MVEYRYYLLVNGSVAISYYLHKYNILLNPVFSISTASLEVQFHNYILISHMCILVN